MSKRIEKLELSEEQRTRKRLFAQRLKACRIAAELSIEEAAKRAEVGKNTWVSYEDEEESPSPNAVRGPVIANVVNTSFAYLTGEIDDLRPIKEIIRELKHYSVLIGREPEASKEINQINQRVTGSGPIETSNPLGQEDDLPFYVTAANPSEQVSNEELRILYQRLSAVNEKLHLLRRIDQANDSRRRSSEQRTDSEDES